LKSDAHKAVSVFSGDRKKGTLDAGRQSAAHPSPLKVNDEKRGGSDFETIAYTPNGDQMLGIVRIFLDFGA